MIELCAGTGALTCRLLGVSRPTPYMGNKRKYAAQILGLLRPSGARLILADPGPWGDTWAALAAGEVSPTLEALIPSDPREHADLWRRLASAPVPADRPERAAAHLVMQALSFRGKPIGVSPGAWTNHGINLTAATGIPGTPRFGEVKPQLFGLLSRVLAIEGRCSRVDARQCEAGDIEPMGGESVYLDPPYVGTEGYGHDLPREEVVRIALAWREAGSDVVISEQEPIDIPGWAHHRLPAPASRLGRKRREEWLTYSVDGLGL